MGASRQVGWYRRSFTALVPVFAGARAVFIVFRMEIKEVMSMADGWRTLNVPVSWASKHNFRRNQR